MFLERDEGFSLFILAVPGLVIIDPEVKDASLI